MNRGFKITGGKGFHITFDNGYTVSVQFGPGNYCDNYNMDISTQSDEAGKIGSTTAECAVWKDNGDLIAMPEWGGDTVSNRSTPADVLRLLNWAASQP
jgi:hypothetical protein